MKQWLTNAINSSPTFGAESAADMKNIGGMAVKFDTNGKIALCNTAGELALGVVTIDNDAEIKAGDTVSVQVKDIGVVYLGAAVTKGAELTVDANGSFAAAAAGDYVRAIALGNGAKDTLCSAMLCNYIKSGLAE